MLERDNVVVHITYKQIQKLISDLSQEFDKLIGRAESLQKALNIIVNEYKREETSNVLTFIAPSARNGEDRP